MITVRSDADAVSCAAMRGRKGHASGKVPRPFIGVVYRDGNFHARVRVCGRLYKLGSWPTAREAAIARDRLLLHVGDARSKYGRQPKLQIAEDSRRLGAATAEELCELARRRREEVHRARRYLGVYRQSGTSRWTATVSFAGKVHTVVGWSNARAAAMARDRLALRLLGPTAVLDFPRKSLVPATVPQLRRERDRRRRVSRGRNRYIGALTIAHRVGWCAISPAGGPRGSVPISGFASAEAAAGGGSSRPHGSVLPGPGTPPLPGRSRSPQFPGARPLAQTGRRGDAGCEGAQSAFDATSMSRSGSRDG